MSIKLELDAESIKNAITTHISNQGFDLVGKTIDVALINGRGGNGNRATVTISDDDTPIASLHTASEVNEEVKEINNLVTEAPIELPDVGVEKVINIEQDNVIMPDLDPILAAAEGHSDSFASVEVESDIFPKVNPSDVKKPASLF